MKRSAALAAVLLSIGAAVGYLVGRPTGEPPAAPAAAAAPAAGVAPAAADRTQPAAGGRVREAVSAPRTLSDILGLESDFAQTAALYRLLEAAGVERVRGLIAEAEALPEGSDRRAALSILYARHADLDPAAALAFLERRGYGSSELSAVFHAWARADLEAAAEAAAGLMPPQRQVAAIAILGSRDDLPVDAQRSLAGRIGVDQDLVLQLANGRAQRALAGDPAAAWESALSASGPLEHSRLAGVAAGWAQQDPRAAMEAVSALGNASLRARLEAQVLHHWSRQNPEDAVDWAMAQPPTPQRRQLIATALSGMADSQPQLALDLAQSLDGAARGDAVARVLSTWAAADPVAASRAVQAVTSPQIRQNAIGNVASAYASQDPEGALQWLASLPAEEAGHGVVTLFSVLSMRDAAQAGTLVNRLPEGGNRTRAAQVVAQAWAQYDPQAAASWVETLVDEGARREAAAGLARGWAQYDRQGALGFAERMPEAAERDAALVGIIQSQHGDPEFAESLYDRLTEPAQRRVAARQLYLVLREADPARAARYREEAGFTGDTRLSQ